MIRRFILALLIVLMITVPVYAKSVTFTWEYETTLEEYMTEFRVYESDTSGMYATGIRATALPNERTLSIVIPDTDATYYWVMTAANTMYGTESMKSEEVSLSIQGGEVIYPLPMTTPLMKSIRVSD